MLDRSVRDSAVIIFTLLIRRQIFLIERNLDRLEETRDISSDERSNRDNLVKEYQLIMSQEIMWKKSAKIKWLKEGVDNTSFFHRTCLRKKKKVIFLG